MIISLVLVAYVFVSYVLPFKASWRVKLGLTVFFLVISQKFTYYYYFGGHMFNPQLSETTLIIWESLFNILLVLVPLLVVKDVLFVLVTVVNKATGSHVPWPLKEAKNRWLILIFSVAAAIWASSPKVSLASKMSSNSILESWLSLSNTKRTRAKLSNLAPG